MALYYICPIHMLKYLFYTPVKVKQNISLQINGNIATHTHKEAATPKLLLLLKRVL